MKIRVEHGDFEDNELVLRCGELDDEMLEVLALLRERSARLAAHKDGETHMLQPADIFYAEAVDGKTFVYTANMVLETAQSLTQLVERHGEAGLLRIGKSQLVNLYHVAHRVHHPTGIGVAAMIYRYQLQLNRETQKLNQQLEQFQKTKK